MHSSSLPRNASTTPYASAGSLFVQSSRPPSIDALRGLVILFMLLDHVRETFFLHLQVSGPMAVAGTAPGLFASRMPAHL